MFENFTFKAIQILWNINLYCIIAELLTVNTRTKTKDVQKPENAQNPRKIGFMTKLAEQEVNEGLIISV